MSVRVLLRIALVAACGLSIAACGVKSSPETPEGSNYPGVYPKPLKALPPAVEKDQRRGAVPAGANPNAFYQYPNTPPRQ